MPNPKTGPDQVGQSAQALVQLGFGDTPEVAAVLHAAAVDQSADLSARRGRGLTSVNNLLHHRQILLALGSLDTTEAVPSLRVMAHNRALSSVVRLPLRRSP